MDEYQKYLQKKKKKSDEQNPSNDKWKMFQDSFTGSTEEYRDKERDDLKGRSRFLKIFDRYSRFNK